MIPVRFVMITVKGQPYVLRVDSIDSIEPDGQTTGNAALELPAFITLQNGRHVIADDSFASVVRAVAQIPPPEAPMPAPVDPVSPKTSPADAPMPAFG